MNEKIVLKKGDSKSFIVILNKQSLISRVKQHYKHKRR